MNLSSEIVNRLVTLKSLLDIGDIELISLTASRLVVYDNEEEIVTILAALSDHRYSEAALIVNKILSEGTRLSRWIDPEIALLEAELERVTVHLADLETEQAELGQLISRFQSAHNEALGERLRMLLLLRMKALERQAKIDPEKNTAYEQASRDFEGFEQDQETQRESNARNKWNLTEEEQKELKSLFRKGSKKCHPDLVPAEHHDAASQMFRELRQAYDTGNIELLRQLVKRAEAGLFDDLSHNANSDEQQKEHLRARIAAIRAALDIKKTNIETIKHSPTYQTMMQHANWAELFSKQALLLDKEIEKLSVTIE